MEQYTVTLMIDELNNLLQLVTMELNSRRVVALALSIILSSL